MVAAPVMMIAGPANATEALPTQAVVSTDGTQELTNESPEANNVDVVAPKQLGSADAAVQYSVTITNVPSQARAASQVMVRGTSKGSLTETGSTLGSPARMAFRRALAVTGCVQASSRFP